MKWYWKVRIYNRTGQYAQACVETEREIFAIDRIQDFYKDLTGCKMLLEGMSESWPTGVGRIGDMFNILWKDYHECR